MCVGLSAFQGALRAAIRGEQEAHHCGGRKTPAVGDWWKGRLERQQWVVGEVLEDSRGGKEGSSGGADPDLVESPGLTSSECRYVIMRLATANQPQLRTKAPNAARVTT